VLQFENFVVGWFLSKAAETAFQSFVDIRSSVKLALWPSLLPFRLQFVMLRAEARIHRMLGIDTILIRGTREMKRVKRGWRNCQRKTSIGLNRSRRRPSRASIFVRGPPKRRHQS
jgi:hypothetical protein